MARSKKITLGFVVVNTLTGIHRSRIFSRRAAARAAQTVLIENGLSDLLHLGIAKLEEHVPAEWVRGKDFHVVDGRLVDVTGFGIRKVEVQS